MNKNEEINETNPNRLFLLIQLMRESTNTVLWVGGSSAREVQSTAEYAHCLDRVMLLTCKCIHTPNSAQTMHVNRIVGDGSSAH